MLLGEHVARRWGLGAFSALLLPTWLCPFLLGLSHGIWTKLGQLSSRVDCRQRGTSVLLAWLLLGAWLLAPQDGSSLGHQVFPFWADHRAVLCLSGARAPEMGSLGLLFVLRGVPILGLESLAWVCLSCPCLSDTQVLRGGLLCGSFCSRGPLWRECPRLDLSEFLTLEQFSSCHLKLLPGHRAVFSQSRDPAGSTGGVESRGACWGVTAAFKSAGQEGGFQPVDSPLVKCGLLF